MPAQHFEERVFACVVDDDHLYVRRPLSDSLFQIACRAFDDRDIRCLAHYTVTKQRRAQGNDWVCTDVHTQHAEACIEKARRVQAELQATSVLPKPSPRPQTTAVRSHPSQSPSGMPEAHLMDSEAPQPSPAEQGHARIDRTDLPPSQQSADNLKPHHQNLECPRVSIVMHSPTTRTGLNQPGFHKASEKGMSHHIRRLSYAAGDGQSAATEHSSGTIVSNGSMTEPVVKHESPPQTFWQDASNAFAADAEWDEQPGLASGSGSGSPPIRHGDQEVLQDAGVVPQDEQVLSTRGEKQQPASIEAIKLAFEAATAAVRSRSASLAGPSGLVQPPDASHSDSPTRTYPDAGIQRIVPETNPSDNVEGYDSAVEVFTKRSSSPLNAPPPRRPSPPSEAQLRGKRDSSMGNPQARGSGRPARIARTKAPLQSEVNLQPTPPLSRSNHDEEGEESPVSVGCGEGLRGRRKVHRTHEQGDDEGSDASASPTPSQVSDEVPYSPSRDPDHTVWAGPAKLKGAKKQKQKDERPITRSKSRTPVSIKRKGVLLDEPLSKKQRSASRQAESASALLSGNTTPRKGRSSRLSAPNGAPSARNSGASQSAVKMTSEESNDTRDAKEVSGRSASAAFNSKSREAATRPNKRRREERESSPEIPVAASNNSKRLREESRRHRRSKSRSKKRDKDEDAERDERRRQRREERRRRRAEAAAEAEAAGDLEGTAERDEEDGDDAINVRAELHDAEAQELARDEEEREERRRERERRDELGKEPSERRKKHLIQSWTASVVLAGSKPSPGSSAAPPVARPLSGSSAALGSASPTQDVKLTSIALPPRVLARFHSLGIESTSDLTGRGVHKGDYAALLRHLMTLPEREVTASSEQNFDEVEAWLAERRMMAL